MANVLYPNAKAELLSAGIDWLTDDIRLGLYTGSTTYNSSHTNTSQLGGTQIAAGSTLTGKAVTNGYAISSAAVYNALSSGSQVAVAVLYRFTDGVLVAYMDSVNGFPFQPTGGNYTVTPGGASSSFFSL